MAAKPVPLAAALTGAPFGVLTSYGAPCAFAGWNLGRAGGLCGGTTTGAASSRWPRMPTLPKPWMMGLEGVVIARNKVCGDRDRARKRHAYVLLSRATPLRGSVGKCPDRKRRKRRIARRHSQAILPEGPGTLIEPARFSLCQDVT